jgi:hypothetical protein
MKLGRLIEILQEYEKSDRFYTEINVYLKDSSGDLVTLYEEDISIDEDDDLILKVQYERLV